MSYNIIPTPDFAKELKRLSKKYPSLKEDLKALFSELRSSPFKGTSLGSNCYKIRLAITSKGQGKSGGARIVTHVAVVDQEVFLLSIYDKAEISTITDKEIKNRLKDL